MNLSKDGLLEGIPMDGYLSTLSQTFPNVPNRMEYLRKQERSLKSLKQSDLNPLHLEVVRAMIALVKEGII